MTITLQTANRMIEAGRRLARQKQLKPLSFCVLDVHGHIVSAQSEDGGNLLQFELAHNKAWGCLGMGHSTRYFKDVLMKERPHMAGAIDSASRGRFVPEYGGVLVRDPAGELLGAIGLAGDTEDNDEAVALHVIEDAGLKADLD